MIIFYNYGHLSITVCVYSDEFVWEKVEWKISNEILCFDLRSCFLIMKFCHNHVHVEGGVFVFRIMLDRLFCLGLAKS